MLTVATSIYFLGISINPLKKLSGFAFANFKWNKIQEKARMSMVSL